MLEEITTDRLQQLAKEARQIAALCDKHGWMDGLSAARQQAHAFEDELQNRDRQNAVG